jgi:sensor histidine kinase regulating citrate/malate metabolism
MVDGAKLDFIEAGDLYCLFGNLTDNALEAVAKIANKEKRIINIIVKMVDNMLIIQEENYYDGNINFDDDGLPITSKEDKDYHGFGIQSIKLLVEKYHGVLTTFVNDDVFHLNILFNLHNIQNK